MKNFENNENHKCTINEFVFFWKCFLKKKKLPKNLFLQDIKNDIISDKFIFKNFWNNLE